VKIADVQVRGMLDSLLPGEPHAAPSPAVMAESVAALLRSLHHSSDQWSSVVSSAVTDRLALVDSLVEVMSHQCRSDSVSVDSCQLVTGDTDSDSADKAVTDVIDTDMPSGRVYKIINTHTRQFNGPLSGTTRVSRYQKGKTTLNFTEARDSEWQWHQLGHMQVCSSLQTDNHASIPPLSFFTGRMPFLLPNQQHQSTEGTIIQ